MDKAQTKRLHEIVTHLSGKGTSMTNTTMKAILFTVFLAAVRALNEMGQKKFMSKFRKGGKREFARFTLYIVNGKPKPNFRKKK